MKILVPIISIFVISSCTSSIKDENTFEELITADEEPKINNKKDSIVLPLGLVTDDNQLVEWLSWDSISKQEKKEVSEFWNNFTSALISKQEDSVIQQIQFPLQGEWGYVMGLRSSEDEWTKDDFKKGYDLILSDLVINRIADLEVESFSYKRSNNDHSIKYFQTGVSLIENGEDFESARLFNFCKTLQGYKLCVIFHAG